MDGRMPQPESASSDHLAAGDIFSIYGFDGENRFRLVKVLAIKQDSIHLYIYAKQFVERPSAGSLDSWLKVPSGVGEARESHLAVSRKLLSLMRPVFLGNRAVEDIELSGYRQWCLTEGKIAGSQFSMEDEVDDNVMVYVKIFLLTSVPFFLVFSFFYYFHLFGWLFDFQAAFKTSVAYGLAMVCLQWASVRNQKQMAGKMKRRLSVSSIQFTETTIPLPFAEAFERARVGLDSVKNARPILVDPRGGTLEGRVGASILEEGQEILVVLHRIDDDKTGAIVWSESDAGVTVDLGRNLSNVNKIIETLSGGNKLSGIEANTIQTGAGDETSSETGSTL